MRMYDGFAHDTALAVLSLLVTKLGLMAHPALASKEYSP